jgi:GNAT superfamily N-acetyltransferase
VLRRAVPADRSFLLEMAREASTLEGRPHPSLDDATLAAFLPGPDDAAIVAHRDDARLGAAWWVVREPPLVDGLPELFLAVVESERGQGVGAALLDALAREAAGRFPALSLNVHLLSPAVHLYARSGYRVAGAGRGRFGVAMIRDL